jgi:hypothetical protein
VPRIMRERAAPLHGMVSAGRATARAANHAGSWGRAALLHGMARILSDRVMEYRYQGHGPLRAHAVLGPTVSGPGTEHLALAVPDPESAEMIP